MKTAAKLSSKVKREPRACTSLAERGATRIMKSAAGRIAAPACHGRVTEHVLHELLADEHRAHQRAEHDDAADGGHPEGGPRGDLEIIERVLGAPLADDEEHQGHRGDGKQAQHQLAHVWAPVQS